MDSLLLGWPYVGVLLALGWIGWLLRLSAAPYAARFRDPAWLLWTATPLYLIHQFEEHGIDLLGRHYQFLQTMCATLGHTLDDCPADPWFIIAVNVPLIWFASPLCGALGPRRAMAGAAMFSIPLVNAVAHIAPFVRTGTYNPGLLTSLLLFLPACGWVYAQLFKQGLLDKPRFALCVVSGVALHGVLMASLKAVEHGLINRPICDLIQVLNAFSPVLLGFLVVPANQKSS